MGNIFGTPIYYGEPPKELPRFNEPPTFDLEYGFSEPRKPREAKLSIQEMKALRIPKHLRDYCAQYYRDYFVCYRKYAPCTYLCKPEIHAYEHCETEDVILRMKEYEREKRLRMRKLKKEGALN